MSPKTNQIAALRLATLMLAFSWPGFIAPAVIDARILRKLDESGFIDRTHAAQGVRLK